MRIGWTPPAARDLRALRAYILNHDPAADDRIAQMVLSAVERLGMFPASGRAGRKPDTRELVVPGTPYFVAYRVRLETVDILRVIHGARQWP